MSGKPGEGPGEGPGGRPGERQGGAAVDPGPIMRLSTAYWGAQTLLTANRIGLFEALAEGPMTVEQVATALGRKARPTGLLLRACVALGLLEDGAEGFRNSPLSQAFLVPGRDSYLGNAIRYSDNMYEAWGRLDEALAEDAPPMAPESYLGGDPERTRHFVYGMHNRALGIGRALVHLVDLSGRRQMLDVGGGPGTYSALFIQRHPGLSSKVIDLPGVVELAKEILASLKVADAVTTIPGDYHSTDFPDENDVVLISGVFHRESAETCRDLIRRGRDSLQSGGLLVVSDVFTDRGGTGPAFATLFGLNMLLSATDGGVHSDADVADWMAEAGFGDIEARPFPAPLPHRVVVGSKP